MFRNLSRQCLIDVFKFFFQAEKKVDDEFFIQGNSLKLKEMLILRYFVHGYIDKSMTFSISTYSHILIDNGMFHSYLDILSDYSIFFLHSLQLEDRIQRLVHISNHFVVLVIGGMVLKGEIVAAYCIF